MGSPAAAEKEKLFIHAFREIRNFILQNGLRPGDLLPSEAQLCAEIGVSRNVLREAIKSMELMDLVEACPGRGTRVKEFSLDFIFQHVLFFNMAGDDASVRQMFDIRKTLELGYMRQAFDCIRPEDIRVMREQVEQMRVHWEKSSAFAENDMRFHQTLFAPIGNPVLTSLLNSIWAIDISFQLEEKLPHLASSVTKHEAIVDALERYDYMAFAHAMYSHYSSGKYVLLHSSYAEY